MPDYKDNTGVAYPNDYKKEDKHPDFRGKGNFRGLQFDIGVWHRTNDKGELLSFTFSEPYKKEQSLQSKKDVVLEDIDDAPISLEDIPF